MAPEPRSYDMVPMTDLINRAADVLEMHYGAKAQNDMRIPEELMKEARGVAVLFNYQFSIGVTSSVGSGILIAKKPGSEEWGCPIALGLGGVGVGLVIGAHKDETVLLLMSDAAVKTMCKAGLKCGADMQIALGPTGVKEDANAILASREKPVDGYAYGKAVGLVMGGGFTTQVVSPMYDKNAAFYGVKSPSDGGPAADALVLGDAPEGAAPSDAIGKLQGLLKVN
uniref:Ysc84 actin-binding domain-containing protein n=1 Tax=Chlamydomonas euryale TaxID=1486919 RepID=A0A7R9VIN1_9CHLO|mmetsp:Transcript_36463/g.107675  ORF Transcript_36463/g.107675 Transcript_36463/m.107675 type:complete len:226 (+) Transcript_36463:167-844(+)